MENTNEITEEVRNYVRKSNPVLAIMLDCRKALNDEWLRAMQEEGITGIEKADEAYKLVDHAIDVFLGNA